MHNESKTLTSTASHVIDPVSCHFIYHSVFPEYQDYVKLPNAELFFSNILRVDCYSAKIMRLFFLIFCFIGQSFSAREIPRFDYLNEIIKNDGGVCGSTCAGRHFKIKNDCAHTMVPA